VATYAKGEKTMEKKNRYTVIGDLEYLFQIKSYGIKISSHETKEQANAEIERLRKSDMIYLTFSNLTIEFDGDPNE